MSGCSAEAAPSPSFACRSGVDVLLGAQHQRELAAAERLVVRDGDADHTGSRARTPNLLAGSRPGATSPPTVQPARGRRLVCVVSSGS
jgi:hypothetical protein